MSDHSPTPPRTLLQEVLAAYEEFLVHQGAASNSLTRWTDPRRGVDFEWLGGHVSTEPLVLGGGTLRVPRSSSMFDAVKTMHTTVVLNPYERDAFYGFPFVIGRQGGKVVRGPLLLFPVDIRPAGDGYEISPREDALRFNGLLFRPEQGSASDLAISTLSQAVPDWPVSIEDLRTFLGLVSREFPDIKMPTQLSADLSTPPSRPDRGEFLEVVQQGALVVARRANYFLVSDLQAMASGDAGSEVLNRIIEGAADVVGPEFTDSDLDSARLFFPFPSNRAQRRVALLGDDPNTSFIRIEGPPGTGKSLTIANLACHFAAQGKSVLISSQKDKALSVVDEKLKGLGIRGFPMTLLRQDKEAKKELLSRIAEASTKTRVKAEVQRDLDAHAASVVTLAKEYADSSEAFTLAAEWEDLVYAAALRASQASGIAGALRRLQLRWKLRQSDRQAPRTTAQVAEDAKRASDALVDISRKALAVSAELGVAAATQAERQNLKQLEKTLQRDQRNAKNFHLFDRMKADPARARMFVRLLPVWIMAPDDVARLFPPEPGLFDVVIVDEASQVDLPSIFPVLQRAKKVIVSGDTKQMQPRRLGFTPGSVSAQAWQRVKGFQEDVVPFLHPIETSLLDLAIVRAEEDVLLDEHFRSLPPIIDFSNSAWYEGRLRVMTDVRRKRFGSPDHPVMVLHHVSDGEVDSVSGQENAREANALVSLLSNLVVDPDYAEASIGVLCLFEDQVALVQELVAELIPEQEWEDHQIVVVNPDGFQGDERDVILYSMSFDDKVMPRSALSARQQDSLHVQGMLNVAFTRARDEVHVFHTAPIESFVKSDGTGKIGEWLKHVEEVQTRPREAGKGSRLGSADSDFELQVADQLERRGVAITHQYPACGFFIDLMCELHGRRVGVECDGPTHFDDRGRRTIEDLERLAVLRRAGWTIVNIPYRDWHRSPGDCIAAVLVALSPPDGDRPSAASGPSLPVEELRLPPAEHAVFECVKAGLVHKDDVLRGACRKLGYSRLGSRLRHGLELAAQNLVDRGLIAIEEGECFLTERGRGARTHSAWIA